MRVYLLYLVVAVLTVYAWRNWFVVACAMVTLMGVMQHEDMPKSIAGLQGLNMWNLLLVSVVAGWLLSRRNEGGRWDMPQGTAILFGLFALVMLGGFARLLLDRTNLDDHTILQLVSEELINTFKWFVPGALIFDGCRTKKRVKIAVAAIALMYVMLAAQVARRMPASSAFGGGGDRIHKIRLKTCRGIGYSVPDMSTILAGASWGCLATWPLLARKKIHKGVVAIGVLVSFYGQMLTGGRAGYLAWAVTGLLMCMLRWRKGLFLAPAVPVLVYIFMPGTVTRLLQGFDTEGPAGTGQVVQSEYEITSGRNLMWPHVIEKITESPVIGYGRLAMIRTGLRDELGRLYGAADAFPHPHNIYLEWLLDNGVVGLIPVLLLYMVMLVRSATLFADRSNVWCSAAGGMAFAMLLVQLVAGIGSQHFYPRESTVGMWAAAGLAMRVWVERRRAIVAGAWPQRPAVTLPTGYGRVIPT